LDLLRIPVSSTNFYAFDEIPEGFQCNVLIPKTKPHDSLTWNGITYDFSLKGDAQKNAYLSFVKETIFLEKRRPYFQVDAAEETTIESAADSLKQQFSSIFDTTSPKSIEAYNEHVFGEDQESITDISRSIQALYQKSTVIESVEDLKSDDKFYILFHCNVNTTECQKYIPVWNRLVDKFCKYMTFYVMNTYTNKKVLLEWGFSGRSKSEWGNDTSERYCIDFIHSQLNRRANTVHELSTGELLQEREDSLWERVLGTYIFPSITIAKTLSLLDDRLSYKDIKSGESSTIYLTTSQSGLLRTLLTTPEIGTFSLSHAFHLFSEQSGKPQLKVAVANHSLSEPPVVPGNDAFRTLLRQQITSKSAGHPLHNEILGTNVQETVWGSIPESKKIQSRRIPNVVDELEEYESEFWDSKKTPVSDIPYGQPNEKIFQYGFLLFLLKKQRSNRQLDLDKHIQQVLKSSYKITVPDPQPSIDVALQWVDESYEFLINLPTVSSDETLEMILLLSIYQHVQTSDWKVHKLAVFRFMIVAFCHFHLVQQTGTKVPASLLWEHFLLFLRSHQLDFVGFFGTQADFNEQLREQGFEQKRISSGKIWMDTLYVRDLRFDLSKDTQFESAADP
jgi:hypothetical protein